MTSIRLQPSAIQRWAHWGQALMTGFVPPLLVIGLVLGGFFGSCRACPNRLGEDLSTRLSAN
ncbi:hypothetical protein Alvin_1686 [Allochromatium vinosum DSM 180]|uniref:Uncharacterized protein n=1 Tax=Allochromatium vinosum (strain ATCC 17899 / DSM 180 / NBRC 103801 / NCIMB 10441 / D) TaxID=572477 RepID=D3RTV9_ALLVD|nr:hypothetical protein Alvin_1686 [Allochromatium vinosum DSM 180]